MPNTQAALVLVGSSSLSIPARVWQANAGRTLPVPAPGGPGPSYGVTISPNATLIWPAKDAAEFLDFSLDLSAWLGSGGDSVARVTAAYTDSNLALLSQVLSSSLATFWFAGGTPGQNALLNITVLTSSGRVGRFSVTLPVAPLDAVEIAGYAPPLPVMSPATLFGRSADSSGPPEPITLGAGLNLEGLVLSAPGGDTSQQPQVSTAGVLSLTDAAGIVWTFQGIAAAPSTTTTTTVTGGDVSHSDAFNPSSYS